MTSILATAAKVLGRERDACAYQALASAIADAFDARFFEPDSGWYASGSQTAQAMPLWFGIVPEEHREGR